MSPEPAPPSSYGSIDTQVAAAVNQYRATAKWIMTGFAGLITILLAGVQITSLGNATGWRLFFAIVGVALALMAAIAAGRSALNTQVPRSVTYTTALDWATKQDTNAKRLYDQAITKDFAGKLRGVQEDTNPETFKGIYRHVQGENRVVVENFLGDLTAVARLDIAQRDIQKAWRATAASAIVVAAGIVLYAWASDADTSTSPDQKAAVSPMPVLVVLHLMPSGVDQFKSRIGSTCADVAGSASGVQAIAVDSDDMSVTIVLIPSKVCPDPSKLVVMTERGYATSVSSLTLPTR